MLLLLLSFVLFTYADQRGCRSRDRMTSAEQCRTLTSIVSFSLFYFHNIYCVCCAPLTATATVARTVNVRNAKDPIVVLQESLGATTTMMRATNNLLVVSTLAKERIREVEMVRRTTAMAKLRTMKVTARTVGNSSVTITEAGFVQCSSCFLPLALAGFVMGV